MRRNAEVERAATHFVDQAIHNLLNKRRTLLADTGITTLTPTDERTLDIAITPARVAARALYKIRGHDYQLRDDLAIYQLREIARHRLNIEFHLLRQAQALATVPRRAPIVAGRTITQAAA